jgi:hypothetical protein
MSEPGGALADEPALDGSLGGLPVVRWLALDTLRPRHGWVAFDTSDPRVVVAARHAYATRMRLRGTVCGSGCEVVLAEPLERVGDAVYRWEEFPTHDLDEARPQA